MGAFFFVKARRKPAARQSFKLLGVVAARKSCAWGVEQEGPENGSCSANRTALVRESYQPWRGFGRALRPPAGAT